MNEFKLKSYEEFLKEKTEQQQDALFPPLLNKQRLLHYR